MRRWILTVVVLATVSSAVGAWAEDTPWFDLENCAMCKNMTAEEGLIDHMKWENHLIASGMMMVTMVEPAYEPAFERAMVNMQAVGAKMMGGEQVYLCGFCQSYGGLMMSGAKIEQIETSAGAKIMLMTSADEGTIKIIQDHAQRTIDEFAKMSGAHEGGGHEGHGSH